MVHVTYAAQLSIRKFYSFLWQKGKGGKVYHREYGEGTEEREEVRESLIWRLRLRWRKH